jgi:hypothetical protein
MHRLDNSVCTLLTLCSKPIFERSLRNVGSWAINADAWLFFRCGSRRGLITEVSRFRVRVSEFKGSLFDMVWR